MAEDQESDYDHREIALRTMSRVLGPTRAQQLMTNTLAETGLTLTTADDLYRFGRELQKLSGFEAAVGAMLGLEAVMRGARSSN